MKKLLFFGLVASVLNVLVVWVLTHFLIIVLGAANSGVTKELFQRQIQALENERIELQDQLASLRVDLLNSNDIFEKAKMLLSDLYASWNRLDPMQRLQFLHFLVPHGLVK